MVDKALFLSDLYVVLYDYACSVLGRVEELLVSLKFTLLSSEHQRVGFPHSMGQFLVPAKLQHIPLDEYHNPNHILVALD